MYLCDTTLTEAIKGLMKTLTDEEAIIGLSSDCHNEI